MNEILRGHMICLLDELKPSEIMQLIAQELPFTAPNRNALLSDLSRFAESVKWTEKGTNEEHSTEDLVPKSHASVTRIVKCTSCDWRGSVKDLKVIEGLSSLLCPSCKTAK
jgi:hypothetical protein